MENIGILLGLYCIVYIKAYVCVKVYILHIYKHFIDEFQTSIKVNFKAILTSDIVIINMPVQQHCQHRIQKQKAKHTFSEPLKKMKKKWNYLQYKSVLKAYLKERKRERKLFKKEKEGFFCLKEKE